jgi:hypothetical protein
MTTYIYRDFNREPCPDGSGTRLSNMYFGSIIVDVLTGHRLQAVVEGLQENGNHVTPIDYPCGQGILQITVHPDVDIYDAIMAVLDKLTADHTKLVTRGAIHQDFLVCSDALVRAHPELCRDDEACQPHIGGPYMLFTRETLKYVDVYDDSKDADEDRGFLVLEGAVDASGQFTYDYPVISSTMPRKYYELTRGKPVWKVTYQDLYPNPLYTQEIGFIYRDFLMDDALEPVGVRLLFVAADAVEVQATGLSLSATRYGVESHGDLYSTIIEILDNITEEHQDVLQEACYRDYVYCSRDGGDVDPLSCRKYARKDSVDSEDPTHQDLGGGWFVCNDYTVSYMCLPSFT